MRFLLSSIHSCERLPRPGGRPILGARNEVPHFGSARLGAREQQASFSRVVFGSFVQRVEHSRLGVFVQQAGPRLLRSPAEDRAQATAVEQAGFRQGAVAAFVAKSASNRSQPDGFARKKNLRTRSSVEILAGTVGD